MYEDHASNEAEALAVACLLVRHGVAMQDVGQGFLAFSLSHQTEVGVGGKCSSYG